MSDDHKPTCQNVMLRKCLRTDRGHEFDWMIAPEMGEGQQIKKLESLPYANEVSKLKRCVRGGTLTTCWVSELKTVS